MMFRVLRNKSISETSLLEEACQAIRRRLPPGWSLTEQRQQVPVQTGRFNDDVLLTLADPQGLTADVIIEVKRRPLEAREVSILADRWARALPSHNQGPRGHDRDAVLMVVAPFLGPSAKDRLAEAGISFADSTGNLRLVSGRPAVFIEAAGAVRNPWRENLSLRSLRGSRSGRVVRALLDHRPPFGTRELSSLTGNAPASVSRVADLLEREAIIQRARPRGPISVVDWERLPHRWALDYGFGEANELTPCLEARGVTSLMDKLRATDFPHAVTGSFAAVRYAPVAEPRLVTVYTPNARDAINRLGLRPADSGANVLVGKPFDPVVFDRTEEYGGVTYACVTQVAVDLLTGPGRGPAEAESLIGWMRLQRGCMAARPVDPNCVKAVAGVPAWGTAPSTASPTPATRSSSREASTGKDSRPTAPCWMPREEVLDQETVT